MASHTPISLRESVLLLQLFPLTQEQRPILSKEGFWWGRPDLNRRPLPGTVLLALFLRVSLTAPELLHPVLVSKPFCYFLEPVVIPA